MIVILEGPDGSGKTTLAKWLQHRYDLVYHHEGPPPAGVSVIDHYLELLETARDFDVVFDRMALGERVYGPILRGEDRLGLHGWLTFSEHVRAVKARQLVCLPSPAACYQNWKTRKGELFADELKFFQSYAAFAYFAQAYSIPTWDYQRTEPHELMSLWET